MQLRTRARAKVNLLLELRGRREDGFHELHTLFDELELGEELSFEASASGTDFRLELRGAAAALPTGADNLVLRAAHALREAWGHDFGGCFRLDKSLPSGAGLGGGSADAAAALRLCAQARGRDLACPELLDELEEIGRGIGADVAFLVRGGRALAYGRGDEMHPVSREPRLHYVLLLPDLHCDTGRVFRNVDPERDFAHARSPCQGSFPSAELNNALGHIECPTVESRALLRDPSRSQALLEAPSAASGLLTGLFNDLTAPALRAYPRLEELRATLVREGFTELHLSGSGSTFFLVTPTREVAVSTARSLEAKLAVLRADGFAGLGSAPRVLCTSSRIDTEM